MSTHDNALLRGCCDDDPDFLKDKPEGFCPWCNSKLETTSIEEDDDTTLMDGVPFCPCSDWEFWEMEEGNRHRYARQAEIEAQREERINRELARRGE